MESEEEKKKSKQNGLIRYREQADGCQRGWCGGMGIFLITFILASSLPTSPMVLRNCPREAHVSGVGFFFVVCFLFF